MNYVSFNKNNKVHSGNRAGMIRSYRTTRTLSEVLLMILDSILSGFDRTLDILARPVICRLLRGSIALICLVCFVFLIGAMEQQVLPIGAGILIALALTLVEILCLRGK